jgi:hypothetical protein
MITRRTALVVLAIALIGGSTLTAVHDAAAEPTVVEYRFLPQLSVLNESGGIYPRSVDYRVRGTFDFVTETPIAFIYGKRASFDDVNAWASHPILAYVLPVDRVLNLSGIDGHQLPVGAPFDVFQFKGETQDGSSVRLVAAQIGPWLRMQAETTPPVGSADMFSYRLRAVARRTPVADVNDDGIVNAADLVRGVGGSAPFGNNFLEWQRQLGETPPSFDAVDAALSAALAASATATAASVPEPQSLAMIGIAMAGVVQARRRRR